YKYIVCSTDEKMRFRMSNVKVSSKYQIVIPKDIRSRLNIRPGQEIGVIEKGGIAYLVPLKSLDELQGVAQGARIEGFREKKDRLL
ncbi:MAG: AbrB/MazE/SpoVT family DNA-binding domain-containing protein, partial [Mariprofundus sp.]|nr:AbrB/MazE/SpoVT family DNA-binding domain-containing protein [Mariprofundus sp.]